MNLHNRNVPDPSVSLTLVLMLRERLPKDLWRNIPTYIEQLCGSFHVSEVIDRRWSELSSYEQAEVRRETHIFAAIELALRETPLH